MSLEKAFADYLINQKQLKQQRDTHLKKTYDISADDYNIAFEEQGGVCAICKNPPKKCLHVDHNHKTGQIRGLLCPRCNQAIAALESDLLPKFMEYLIKWETRLWKEDW